MRKCPEGYEPMLCPSESIDLQDEDGMVWFYECCKCKATFNQFKVTYLDEIPKTETDITARKWWKFFGWD